MNHCVWPYESGEVIVQAYNTLLTLSSLLDSSQNEVGVSFPTVTFRTRSCIRRALNCSGWRGRRSGI